MKDKILQDILNQVRTQEDYSQAEYEVKNNKELYEFTIGALDRGPRVDHGGGDDGDDWMDDYQVKELEESYFSQNKHKVDNALSIVKKALPEFKITHNLDYGEKGHVTLYIRAVK